MRWVAACAETAEAGKCGHRSEPSDPLFYGCHACIFIPGQLSSAAASLKLPKKAGGILGGSGLFDTKAVALIGLLATSCSAWNIFFIFFTGMLAWATFVCGA